MTCFRRLQLHDGTFRFKKAVWNDPEKHDPDHFFPLRLFSEGDGGLLMRALADALDHGGAIMEIWRTLLQEYAYILRQSEAGTCENSHYLLERILVYIARTSLHGALLRPGRGTFRRERKLYRAGFRPEHELRVFRIRDETADGAGAQVCWSTPL